MAWQPQVIRCGNGLEYISAVTLAWAAKRGIRIDFIQLAQPQQNAYVERYNRTVRYDPGFCNPLAVDLQSRPAQYGTWWHHTKTEACLGRLTSTFSAI